MSEKSLRDELTKRFAEMIGDWRNAATFRETDQRLAGTDQSRTIATYRACADAAERTLDYILASAQPERADCVAVDRDSLAILRENMRANARISNTSGQLLMRDQWNNAFNTIDYWLTAADSPPKESQ